MATTTAPPTIKSVSASQASAGAQKASEHYNQMIAYRKGTSFGLPAPPPPKSQAGYSLAYGATKLAQYQVEWNEICNLFGWKGTGGKARKTQRSRKNKKSTRRVRGGTARPKRKTIHKSKKSTRRGKKSAKRRRSQKN